VKEDGMSEFWKLYRHPEWQKKRLEVMQDAHFLCQECGEGQKTLNVHHTYYLKDLNRLFNPRAEQGEQD
jgi:5-methylcytosine-specific restriction endonuclease McrA